TRACPTDAFTRVLDPEGGVLFLDPERCVGCDACVAACPVKVITMDDEVNYGELTGGRQEAYRSDPERRAAGSHPRRGSCLASWTRQQLRSSPPTSLSRGSPCA